MRARAWGRRMESGGAGMATGSEPEYWSSKRSAIEGIWTDLTDDGLDITFGRQLIRQLHLDRARIHSRHTMGWHWYQEVRTRSQARSMSWRRAGRRYSFRTRLAGRPTRPRIRLRRFSRDESQIWLGRPAKAASRYFPGMESSQRSRTFLFVGAAAVIAAVGGSGQVWLNENGIMALHVPLTAARVGSLSTHTAAPLQSLSACGTWRVTCWRQTSRVDNELVHLTKPGVVERAVSLGHGTT